jgi:tetratricopeptide (TPR) repeat protein
VEWVPRATLAASPAFSRLVAGKEETELAALAPRARRARLGELAQQQPAQARWPLLLARLEREQGEPEPALAAAEAALRLDGSASEARCLRGWARAELGRFGEAAEDLAGCAVGDPGYLVAELAARVGLQQWGEAEALVARLSAEQRRDGEVAALVRRVERGTSTPAASAPATPGRVPGAPADGDRLSASDEARFAQAQSALARARSNEEVLTAYAIAAELAARHDSHRRVQHLAAEIAYRASRWSDAVRHFRAGGDPGEEQPLLLFYLAVALWENGQRGEAAAVMRRCDGKLRATPFVESYRRKILEGEPAPG